MKLIVRADDLGFTEAVNYGIVKTIRDGIVRSTGLMPNMPAAQHGFDLIKDMDNVSVGQHTNIVVGRPVSDPKQIPSLVDADGNFINSKVYRAATEDFVVFEEAVLEIEAQLKRFMEITGRRPDYFEGHAVNSVNFNKGLARVAQKHGLFNVPFPAQLVLHGDTPVRVAMCFNMTPDNMYDPLSFILNDEGGVLDSEVVLMIFHPGYVDQDILRMSSFNMIRPLEVEALCSPQVKQWVADNGIELVNFSIFNE